MNRHRYLPVLAALALASVVATACGKSSSPASPLSPSSPASGTSGATINGTVSGTTSGSAAGYAKLDAGSGITVTIAGTNLTVAVDGNGKFVFTNVPAGTVQLIFTSSGGTSTITLEGVKATDTITVKITIKGASASLDTEERNGTAVTELEDRITAINPPGSTPNALMVGSTLVSVPGTITIRHGGTTVLFTELKVGDRVHVRGTMVGTVFNATEVIVQNTNSNVPVNGSGTVSGLLGACPTIQFTAGGWLVDTNASTDYQKVTCATVANGMTVHFKGDVLPSGHVLASWVQGK